MLLRVNFLWQVQCIFVIKEKTGKGDWQYNLLEELMNMKETSLETNLDITELKTLIDYVSTC